MSVLAVLAGEGEGEGENEGLGQEGGGSVDRRSSGKFVRRRRVVTKGKAIRGGGGLGGRRL
jgi:hypothetical protein